MKDSRFAKLPSTPLTLTVVMPAYNEADTVATAIERVLGLDIPNVDIELVIVESNSSDATRSIVSRYAADSRVRLILQAAPRGKGAAVREGFIHATGDIILIQDADLEYSVEDYPRLLEPIIRGDVDFTLGSRHVPGEPVRVMHASREVAFVMNAAHWVFTWLFNITYGTKLRDPFTMYKVFRAECIEGIVFVADRFDFDWELLGKLVRLGYKPIEIPVEYSARGFEGGKKVRFFRDPPTWIAACLRFRFCRLPARRRDLHEVGEGGGRYVAERPLSEQTLERAVDAMASRARDAR